MASGYGTSKTAESVRASVNRDSNLGDDFFVKVDQKLDDGDLEAGMFRKLSNDRYSFILELE